MMSAEIDELIEDEYAAQQERASHIQTVEINGENDKKIELEVSALLVDISETLRLLGEQMMRLNEVTKAFPETITALRTTTEAIQCISTELPTRVREQCLEEYKKILANAVKNYNQMQKAADKWQQSLEERGTKTQLSTIFIIVTQILLLFNIFFK